MLQFFLYLLQGRYVEEAETYAQQTELSKRVKEWQDRILPVLDKEVVSTFFV